MTLSEDKQKLIASLRDEDDKRLVQEHIAKEGTPMSKVKLSDFIDNVEDASASDLITAFDKALDKIQANLGTQSQEQVKKIEEKVQETNKANLEREAKAFAKKHILFQEALDGKHPDLFSDMNSFVKDGQTIEEAYSKALKANGIEEKSFLSEREAKTKETPPPESKQEQVTATQSTERPPKAEKLEKPEQFNVQDAAKASLDEIMEGKSLEELGIGM